MNRTRANLFARFLTFTLIFFSAFFVAGCSVDQIWNPSGSNPGTGVSSAAAPTPAPKAPWEVWDAAVAGDPVFSDADRLIDRGDLEGALQSYQELETHAISNEIRSRAQLRRLSTMLKLGRSRAVLDDVAKTLKLQGKAIQETDPVFALYAAYAYAHLNDPAQSLVWFSLARKRVNERGIISRNAVVEAKLLAKSIPQDSLNKIESNVANDAFLLALAKDEQLRRSQGGRVESNPSLAWFNPKTYSSSPLVPTLGGEPMNSGNFAKSDIPARDGKLAVGVMLPLTGKYAAHANLVRQGVEMASADAPNSGNVRLVFSDTQAEATIAGNEFERLVQQEGVSAILGPMLVKTAEEVARRSDATGVPFLTFTKRPGITDLSRVGFRLGATAENQCDELASYVFGYLKKKRVAMISPRQDSADDFARCFQAAVRKEGGELVKESTYVAGNSTSIKEAVDAVIADPSPLDAVFVPDSLERAAPVLEAIRNSSHRSALLLGPAYWNESVAVRGYAPLLENAVIVTPFFVQSQRPQVAKFVESYKLKYNRPPDLLTAQAYDLTSLLYEAVAKLSPSAPPAEWPGMIAKVLHELGSQEGVTGKFSIASNGEISRKMSVLRMQNGELVEVMAGGQVRGFLSVTPEQLGVNKQAVTEATNSLLGPAATPTAAPIPASIAK